MSFLSVFFRNTPLICVGVYVVLEFVPFLIKNEDKMEFKLNKLTLVLLSAPLIAHAGISHNGSEHNLLPSNLATNITDNQEHTINGPLSIA